MLLSPRVLTVVAVLGLLAMAGCPPTETPGYSPDGKTIALVAFDPPAKRNAIWLYDVKKQLARAHHVPGDWTVRNVQWIGSQLWAECTRPMELDEQQPHENGRGATSQPAPATEFLLSPFDPRTNNFVAGAPRIVRQSLVADSIKMALGMNEGKPALFVESDDPNEHEIYSLPDLHVKRVDRPLALLTAGRGWTVQVLSIDEGITSGLRGVAVLNRAGERVCAIAADEIRHACHRYARFPIAARVSIDESVVALAFETETIFRNHPRKYTLGVFAANTGKLLWAGGSDSMTGVPVVRREEVWTIEFVDRKVYTGDKPFNLGGGDIPDPPRNRFALVRHRPGKSPSQWDGQRDVIFDYEGGPGMFVRSFAPAPDGSQLLVAADGPQPRLLFVPVKPDATAKDVRVVELK